MARHRVENTEKWSVGHTTEWAYKTKHELADIDDQYAHHFQSTPEK